MYFGTRKTEVFNSLMIINFLIGNNATTNGLQVIISDVSKILFPSSTKTQNGWTLTNFLSNVN